MHRVWLAFTLTSMMWLGACSSGARPEAKIYAAGEKAVIAPLTYAVVDTQIYPQFGDDPATARTPVNRFYVVQLSVSNSSNADVPIPALTLVDDSGKTYNELSDGTGVTNWLGLIRKVEAGGTQIGTIVFDAPSKHYRLRLTDETDPAEVLVDLPLSFVHEQIGDVKTSVDPSQTTAPDAPSLDSPKK